MVRHIVGGTAFQIGYCQIIFLCKLHTAVRQRSPQKFIGKQSASLQHPAGIFQHIGKKPYEITLCKQCMQHGFSYVLPAFTAQYGSVLIGFIKKGYALRKPVYHFPLTHEYIQGNLISFPVHGV